MASETDEQTKLLLKRLLEAGVDPEIASKAVEGSPRVRLLDAMGQVINDLPGFFIVDSRFSKISPENFAVDVGADPRPVEEVVISCEGGRPNGETIGRETPSASFGEGSEAVGTSVKSEVSGNLSEYAEVLAHAVDTFGSKTRADSWLNKPHRLFGYKTPLQVLVTDSAAVEEELVRIDHGIYS